MPGRGKGFVRDVLRRRYGNRYEREGGSDVPKRVTKGRITSGWVGSPKSV